ncbi:MAG: hypothetical protein ACW99G_04905 [Candidatus Thorarchaeota archaeon]
MMIKNFFRELWRHTGFWANPYRVAFLERDSHWQHYMNEVKHLGKELKCPDVEQYAIHVLKQMGCEDG